MRSTRSALCTMFTIMLLTLASLAPAPALAATTCSNETLGAITVRGNLEVPANKECFLNGTTVTGNVTVGPGGDLFAPGAVIGGNVSGSGSAIVLVGARVDGNVTLQGSSSDFRLDNVQIGGRVQVTGSNFVFSVQIRDSTIDGGLTVSNTAANGGFNIANNTVGGNLRFDFNSAFGGNNTIADNGIDGQLRCEGNSPPPIGGGNSADAKRGQCATL